MLVEIKGQNQKVKFPDDMDEQSILQVLRDKYKEYLQPSVSMAKNLALTPMTGGNTEAAQKAAAYAEPAATIATGAIAEPVAGIAGLSKLPFTSMEEAVATIEAVQEAMTYMPKTEEGIAGLQQIGEVIAPVSEMVGKTGQVLRDVVYERTGNPELAGIAQSTPEILLTFAGGKKLADIPKPVNAADRVTPKIFAGVNAKTADIDALERAKGMEKSGATRDDIWKETGWMNDNGDWKFEISDSAAAMGDPDLPMMATPFNKYPEKGLTSLNEALSHEQLMEAYPQLRDYNFLADPEMGPKGRYDRATETIEINKRRAIGQVADELKRAKDPNDVMYWENRAQRMVDSGAFDDIEQARLVMKQYVDRREKRLADLKENFWDESDLSTTLHESQHAVQDLEGFERGGNPVMAAQFRTRSPQMKRYLDGNFSRGMLETLRESPFYKNQVDESERIFSERYNPELQRIEKQLEEALEADDKAGIEKAVDDEMAVIDRFEEEKLAKFPALKREADLLEELKAAGASRKPTDYDLYKALSGEAEARVVQERMKLTPEQRRNRPPWYDLDVEEDLLIRRKRD